MIRQKIPHTEMEVSPICLGTMTFGEPVGEAEAIRVVHRALDLGVNFLDTANNYEGYSRYIGSDGGVAEGILAKALKGRRGEAVLATKVGMKVGATPEDEYASPAAIRKRLDLSLRRLGTDYVDIYYVHRPDPVTPLTEMIGALAREIEAGKIRHYAVSNYSAEQLRDLLLAADGNNLPRPVAHQPPLSLLEQDMAVDLLPLCARERIAVFPYQVLQSGLLTGKYRRGQPLASDSRKAEKDEWIRALDDALFDRLEKIEQEAKTAGLTMTQHAIRWALRQPGVASAIIGVKRIGQLEEAVEAAEGMKEG
jgi:aryl-alcohol dehydrogenase-like predicted oxidoreductase